MDEDEGMEFPGIPPYLMHRAIDRPVSGLPDRSHGPLELFRSLCTPNPSFPAPAPPSPVVVNVGNTSVGSFGNGEMKKRRGRPRKNRPEDSIALISPSMSSPPTVAGTLASPSGSISASGRNAKSRGRPKGSGRKQQLLSCGEWVAGSAGVGFTPYVVTVSEGEDIISKIMLFAQGGSRGICILSAHGVVSDVTFRLPSSTTGGTLTFKDRRYEILHMSGSYFPSDEGGPESPNGSMTILLSTETLTMIGGVLADKLIAAGPVQIILGSFIYGGKKTKESLELKENDARSDHGRRSPANNTSDQARNLMTECWQGDINIDSNLSS